MSNDMIKDLRSFREALLGRHSPSKMLFLPNKDLVPYAKGHVPHGTEIVVPDYIEEGKDLRLL